MATITLDIISDTICPWCYIGKRRLERALAMRPDAKLDIRWRPYQLDPTIPPGGVARAEYLAAKFGGAQRVEEIHDRLRAAAAQDGIDFAFDRITRTPNTINSHRLIRWAGTAGCQEAVVERLFRSYFVEGGDIETPTSLAGIARDCGMDGDLVAELLAGDADIELVEREVVTARKIGVTGVPCFIFADRFGVMGAHPPEVLVESIDRALREQARVA